MTFTSEFDLIELNQVRQFGVLFTNPISGAPFDLENVQIEIGTICENQYIIVLKSPMIRINTGEYFYETLITITAYKAGELYIVKYSGTDPITHFNYTKEEKFRAIGAPLVPQSNIVNILVHPQTRSLASFTNGTNI